MEQLVLWDGPKQPEERPRYPQGEIIVMPYGNANGNASPEALEELAWWMLGELAFFVREIDGVHLFYRIIATGIVDGEVLCAHEYMCTAKEFYGGKESSEQGPDEEEED